MQLLRKVLSQRNLEQFRAVSRPSVMPQGNMVGACAVSLPIKREKRRVCNVLQGIDLSCTEKVSGVPGWCLAQALQY